MLPLHEQAVVTAEVLVENTCSVAGELMVQVVCLVQPSASVIVSEYVAAHKPETEEVVAPLLHEYVYGEFPPVIVTAVLPSQSPLHETEMQVVLTFIGAGRMETVLVREHPLLSVTVME